MQKMDTTIDAWLNVIADFVCEADGRSNDLSHAGKIRVADTIGCALGALDSDASVAARAYAKDRSPSHSIWGTPDTSDLEGSALANGVAARYLDFNDAYFGVEPIHPSDVIPALFGQALSVNATGLEYLESIAIAYEVAVRSSDVIRPRVSGFDHVNVTMLGAVAGAARLLHLSHEKVRHAISIAVTSHNPLRQTRTGQLSMWKAFAAADACQHALYAAALAANGAEGPVAPFTGTNGFFRRVLELSPSEFPELVLDMRKVDAIATSQIKKFPCGSVGQSAGQAASDLVEQGVRLDHVESIELSLDPKSAALMVSPEKMIPRTRETADHSIPYVFISTLERGKLDKFNFTKEVVNSPKIRKALSQTITIVEDQSLAGGHSKGFPLRARVNLTDGRTLEHAVVDTPGSPNNQLDDKALRSKFDNLLGYSPLALRGSEIWNHVWSLDEQESGLRSLENLLTV